jgi:hypothetical protein
VIDSWRKVSFWKRDVLCCWSIGRIMSIWLVLISSSAMAADAVPGPSGPIPATFFGLHMHKPVVMGNQPWPTVPFGAGRLWDCGVAWAQVNTSKGVYDWSLLDKWLTAYHEHGIDDLMYTFGRVPRWASSKPNNSSCLDKTGLGVCDPPNDLKPDGTGPNQHWKDFVTAIATQSKNSHGAHIRYWEIWNEPFMPRMWTGTNAQLERMTRDAREVLLNIDPTAVIVSPPPAMQNPGYERWMEDYLHDGGGKHADVIGLHGYVHTGRPGSKPAAADIITVVKDLRRMLEAQGMGSMTIFDTESSWGAARVMGFDGDEDFEAGFLAQFYLLHWSAGVSRFYWYAWNNAEYGTLWSPDPGNPSGPGHLRKAGVAYQQVHDWMVGATMNPLCSSTGDGIWTCGFTRPGGYEALAVWSTGGNRSYTANAKFKKLRDLDGNNGPIGGGKVNLGFRPILLQNQ